MNAMHATVSYLFLASHPGMLHCCHCSTIGVSLTLLMTEGLEEKLLWLLHHRSQLDVVDDRRPRRKVFVHVPPKDQHPRAKVVVIEPLN
jgi:hypothetical protein